MCSLSPGVPREGPQGKACLSLCSLSPGVPQEGPQWKDCLSLCSLSPGVPWEGSQGKACLSLRSLSPSWRTLRRAPGEGLSGYYIDGVLVFGEESQRGHYSADFHVPFLRIHHHYVTYCWPYVCRERCTVTCQESNMKVFVTLIQRENKAEIISFPCTSPNPNPNCKHQSLTIWLRVTADNCGALHRL